MLDAWGVIFPGFVLDRVPVASDVALRVRHGGSGPAVVLLHGHPRTHTTWHAVAPALAAAGCTVVCPDLRGYGQSSTPEPDEEHRVYADRAMAGDIAELMTRLGHQTFAVVGHDRGSYNAYRCALDHPERVTRQPAVQQLCQENYDDVETLYPDPASIWRSWCEREPQRAVIDSGHHMAEENPAALTSALQRFLSTAEPSPAKPSGRADPP